MHIPSFKHVAIAACAVAAIAATPASAAPIQAQLRVEGPDGTLESGRYYVNDSWTFDTAKSCGGTGDEKTLQGPTALGLLGHGTGFNRRLDPIDVSDEFDFGLFVCAIGGHTPGGNAFWGFRVNHAEAQVGADQFALEDGDSVLWSYIDFDSGLNTGKELVLQTADDWVKRGEAADVRILEFDAEGNAMPAAGVQVAGELTDENGDATITFDQPGRAVVRGTRGSDIATARKRFCVWEESQDECETLPLARIIGTAEADRLEGTSIPERIRARKGDDHINVRDGGVVDVVSCGRGKDTVIADEDDRIRGNCERVKRR